MHLTRLIVRLLSAMCLYANPAFICDFMVYWKLIKIFALSFERALELSIFPGVKIALVYKTRPSHSCVALLNERCHDSCG